MITRAITNGVNPIKTALVKFTIGALALGSLTLGTLTLAAPININTADLPTIMENLVDVGPVKAGAIVEYREQNGPFKVAEDLLSVKGIGAKTLEKNRNNLLFLEVEEVAIPVENTK
ncbi:competence protein ComEA [Ignatzschineria ureiclastica]|uniref:Competence protein ComEA n=2 Tax=Ignatzschineria ureiclastica TaxID=472582 RepID=A0A2U2AHM1_9GAMM|nr:competence protein ComEA [Ignatzschineria ureiclastica]